VTGTIDDNGSTGSADDVVFDNEVEGEITSVDVAGGQIIVLGQVVLIDGSTVFDDSFADPSINGLAVGDFVEVSGFPDANGVVSASRIESGTAGGDLEVRGTVSSLDTGNSTFEPETVSSSTTAARRSTTSRAVSRRTATPSRCTAPMSTRTAC
jgi:hypothetical protein